MPHVQGPESIPDPIQDMWSIMKSCGDDREACLESAKERAPGKKAETQGEM